VLLVALSLAPLHGLFTTDRIFFVRDLSFFFWSRHLWLRQTVATGELPWWDPYVAGGQSAIADALNQLLMPMTLAIRLLPSDVVSFNLWVALPLPIAALGMFAFLRRRDLPPAAAALGASIFMLAGPTVSMLNTPNLAWSVALIPWVLAACSEAAGASAAGRAVRVAIAFALQALCGEPVTWVATGALALGGQVYELAVGGARSTPASRPGPGDRPVSRPGPGSRRFLDLTPVAGGLLMGALLAAAQLMPTLLAGIRANRAGIATPDFWSLHPVSLWEVLAPNLFGNYYDAFLADLPWMGALNFARDPFFYSIYVGPIVLLLAVLGAAGAFRRNAFWVVVALVAVAAALGGYTPFYPLVRKLVPSLMYFRFPVKYIVFAVLACAVLAAEGFAGRAAANRRSIAWAAGGVALTALLLSLAAFGMPDVMTVAAHWLARSTHLKDASAGAEFLTRSAPPLLARASALLLAGSLLVVAAERRRQLLAVLFAAVCADLAVTHLRLNLTMPVAQLSPPAWYTSAAGSQRLYIGGRVRGYMNTKDPDGTPEWQIPVAATAVEGRMELNAQLPMAPSGWRVREALSYDLPYLWPAEYEATVRRFEDASRDERAAFLRRSGVRRCVFPQKEDRQFRPIADVRDWNMQVFECDPGATRVFVPPAVAVAPDPADLAWQREALFDPALPDDVARVPAMPAPAGRPGTPEPPSVRIVHDGAMTVILEATLRESGLVVLRDSFDPSWRAEADGLPAEIVRVNGRYRGVALPPGRHVIRFTYRPRDLAPGLSISVTSGLALFALSWFSRRSRTRTQRGFTLIELMIVMAIIGVLLAIAFTEYRGMQARGNDASAVSSLRSIAAAQWQFALTCGNLKYVTVLSDLARPIPSTGEAFLSPDLTAVTPFEKSGYMFQMTAKALEEVPPACNGAPVAAGYAATADPARPGVTGNYYYGVNADRILYIDQEATFTGNLAESGAAGHGREIK
jgi:prepilin-type N-terminal cleavage/methylation domain-containing protein